MSVTIMAEKLMYFLLLEDGKRSLDCIPESQHRIAECWPYFERWLTEEDKKGTRLVVTPELKKLLDTWDDPP